ncbi:hypothetical protein PM082_020868 [Marasmius tenuissimus]|nr:hypothetical protein PM082_020868 [Marasmius tenuissimus]
MNTTQNTHTGWGMQNNNTHSGQQNVQYGDGQIGQVSGGEVNFVKHFNTTVSNPHKSLWDAIAGVGASHRAEHQFSRGACLKGTRETALASIHDWASAKGPEASPICWLSGAAGVGKSAIALSIAKSFENLSLLTSSFFFFRSDPRRNNPSALMLTIAHGLATTSSLMRSHIEQRILTDPTILEASLEEQFLELVIAPTAIWSRQRSLWGAPVVPNIVIIDGLDECGDEATQLRILSILQSAYQQASHFPLRFLICSRPEAWIQEEFSDEPLSRLSRNIALDDSFEAREDIRQYFVHHFREITTSRKYCQVRFPDPWPSERDLEILVERTCAQFVYASTLVKFIKLACNHPIIQLRIILDSSTERRLSQSPYHDLDSLYHVILSAHPDRDQLILILAAILVIPEHLDPTPASIEQVLELPSGQVSLTLRGMYSVLNIGGQKDTITLYHTSFEEYLVDRTRSCDFYIDRPMQEYMIARRWLQSLSTVRVLTRSEDQLHVIQEYGASMGWISLCTSLPQPTWDLLIDLQRVDLAAVFTWSRLRDMSSWSILRDILSWTQVYEALVPWVKTYPCHATDNRNEVGLVDALVHRFQELPRCFHLKWYPGVELQRADKYQLAHCGTNHPEYTGLDIDGDSQPHAHLSECHCDLSGEHESDDPEHVVYQNACMEYAQALIFKFPDMIARGVTEEAGDSSTVRLSVIFLILTQSALLKHCRLGTELFSLCWTFFEHVKNYPPIFGLVHSRLESEHGYDESRFLQAWRGTANLLEWIETFPEKYIEEGKALEAQVLALPWPKWTWAKKGCIWIRG